MEPHNPVIRHAWLFTSSWIEFSSEEIDEDEVDYEKRTESIRKLRTAAIAEIWVELGFKGLTALLSRCGSTIAVGEVLAQTLTDFETQVEFVRQCFSITDPPEEIMDWCIRSFFWSIDDDSRRNLLEAILEGADETNIVRLHFCAPFGNQTWRLLDKYDQRVRDRYWLEVAPEGGRYSDAELIELIDRLLSAKRPRAAFQAVKFDWSRIETSRLKRILLDIDTNDVDPCNRFQLEDYDISKALSELDSRNGSNLEEMAHLEFKFIDALQFSKHGIPNLERWISEIPLGFVQALALVFDRNDGKQDPHEWQVEDPQKKSALFSSAHDLLMRMSRIPGTGEAGHIDPERLVDWISETRRLCTEYGRADIGDEYIGQILSNSPFDETGTWPCAAVCDAMEQVGSGVIGNGFNIGVIRGRGVTARAIREGGKQERELAEKYRSWAKQRAPHYPFVGSVLDGIAANYDAEAKWHDDKARIDEKLHQ